MQPEVRLLPVPIARSFRLHQPPQHHVLSGVPLVDATVGCIRPGDGPGPLRRLPVNAVRGGAVLMPPLPAPLLLRRLRLRLRLRLRPRWLPACPRIVSGLRKRAAVTTEGRRPTRGLSATWLLAALRPAGTKPSPTRGSLQLQSGLSIGVAAVGHDSPSPWLDPAPGPFVERHLLQRQQTNAVSLQLQ